VAHLRGSLHRLVGREAPRVHSEQRVAALQAIVAALTMIMRHTLAHSGGQTPDRRAFAEASLGHLEAVASTLERPAPPLAPDAEDWVNLLLRSNLLAKRFAVWGGVSEGLGEMILALDMSRRLAVPGPGGGISAEALSEPLAHWRRFVAIELITRILRRARPALIDLFLHTEPS